MRKFKRKDVIGQHRDDLTVLPTVYLLAVVEYRPVVYHELINEYKQYYYSQYSAWMALEADLEALGLPRRYKTYASFFRGRYNLHDARKRDREEAKIDPSQ